jgi:hypothetical protein
MAYRVVSVKPDGTANVVTTVPADLPTATAYAAANGGEVMTDAVVAALVLNGVRSQEAEVTRLNALLPPDTDGTAQMTVSEYQYHLLGVVEGMASLVSGTTAPTQAQTNKRTTWQWRLDALRNLDQKRRINTRVQPFLGFTQKAFDDGLITQAKKTFLDTFGA